VVECLPSKHKALSSNSDIVKKKKKNLFIGLGAGKSKNKAPADWVSVSGEGSVYLTDDAFLLHLYRLERC
jgi:hypothetical protein